MKYISIQESAKLTNVQERRLQQLCKSGEIDGAIKEKGSWKIPETYFSSLSLEEPKSSHCLPLPIGISSYVEATTQYYYVDKTLLLKDFIDTLPKVSLFLRPRRFGKTLNMDMIRVYLEKTETDTSVYFKDKKIWKCGSHYQDFQGKYPVIFLSFKDVKYDSWDKAYSEIYGIMRSEYSKYTKAFNNERINDYEKQYIASIVNGTASEVELSRSLAVLSAVLYKIYDSAVVIMIDEYDTAIQQGFAYGYYDKAISFIRNLFSGAFKDNPHLAYGFLTGILQVAKESIFSGMNNLKVNTILDDRFSSYFGFTEDEVRDILAYYGRSAKDNEIKEWYDGYHFGNSEIYNPWSLINYVDNNCIPKAFWQSTASNEIIGEIINHATDELRENLRRLLQKEELLFYVDTEIIYPDISKNPYSIYSFLLLAGYLKAEEVDSQTDGSYMCKLAIPNKEISIVFEKEIISRLPVEYPESTAIAIQIAFYENNTEGLKGAIEKYLTETISYYGSASESFYQGLLLGLCAVLNNKYIVKSNREAGIGRFDIALYPSETDKPGFIFELKHTKDESISLSDLSKQALKQIEEKHYDEEMKQMKLKEIIKIGLAFRKKEVSLSSN